MTQNIHYLVEQSQGEYDPELLTNIGTSGFLSKGYLETKPVIDYLDEGEIPHFVLSTASQSPTIDGRDTAAPSGGDVGEYRAFGVVTSERILLLVGDAQGDYQHSIPLRDISSLSVEKTRKFLRRHSTFRATTHSGETIEITDTGGENVAEAVDFVKREAINRKIEFAEATLREVGDIDAVQNFTQVLPDLESSLERLDGVENWNQDGPVAPETIRDVEELREEITLTYNTISELDDLISTVENGDTVFNDEGFSKAESYYRSAVTDIKARIDTAREADLPSKNILERYRTAIHRRIALNQPTAKHRHLREILDTAQTAKKRAEASNVHHRVKYLQTALEAYEKYTDTLSTAGFDAIETDTDGCSICGRDSPITREITINADRGTSCAACEAFGNDGELPRRSEVEAEIDELEKLLGESLAESHTITYSDDGLHGFSQADPVRPQLIAAIHAFADEVGRPPAKEELENISPAGLEPLHPYYETVEAVGFNLKATLVEEFRQYDSAAELTPKTADIVQRSAFPESLFQDTFDTVEQARDEAGIPAVASAEWVTSIREFYRTEQRAPAPSPLAATSDVTIESILDDAGSWKEALAAAGIPDSEIPERSTISEEIGRIEEDLGHCPTRRELTYYSRFSTQTLRRLCPEDTRLREVVERRIDEGERDLSPTGPLDEAPDSSAAIPSHTDLLRELYWLVKRHGETKTREQFETLSAFDTDHYSIQFDSVESAIDRLNAVQSQNEVQAEYAPKSQLTEELQDLAAYLGRPPKLLEIVLLGSYSPEKYAQKFTSMGELYAAAGYEWDPQTPSNEELLEDLRQVGANLSHPPRLEKYAREGSYEYAQLIRRFDDWFGALLAAGFSPLTQGYPVVDYRTKEIDRVRFETKLRLKTGLGQRQILLDEIQRLAYELDATPSIEAVKALSQYSLDRYRSQFDSLQHAIESADLRERPSTEAARVAHFREDIQSTLNDLAETLSHPPVEQVVSAESRYSPTSYTITFGSFEAALESIGCSPHDRPPATKSELTDSFRRVVEHLDRTPAPHELGAHSPYPADVYLEMFGGTQPLYEEVETDPPTEVTDESEDSSPDAGDQGAETPSTADQSDTKEVLIAELQRINSDLDRPIKSTDVSDNSEYSPQKYYAEFGSWDDALNAAGIDRREQSLDELRTIIEELGRFPNQGEVDKRGSVSSGIIIQYFDDWKAALRAYAEREGIVGDDAPEHILLGEIQRLANRQPDLVMPSDVRKESPYTPERIAEPFGSWVDALEAAGFDVEDELLDSTRRLDQSTDGELTVADITDSDRFDTAIVTDVFGSPAEALDVYVEHQDEGQQDQTAEKPSDTDERKEQLLASIQSLAADIDRPLKATDLQRFDSFSSSAYAEYFETWGAAIEAAGVDREKRLLQEIHRVVTNTGEIPTIQKLEYHGRVSSNPYYQHFGSWTNALEAYKDQFDVPTGEDDAEETTSKRTTSRENLIDALQSLHDEVDHTIKSGDIRDITEFNTHHYTNEFGSLEKALEVAGIDRRSDMLHELHDVVQELGHFPSRTEFGRNAHISHSMISDELGGSWGDVKQTYEEWAPQSGSTLSDDTKSNSSSPNSAELLQEFHEVAKEIGHLPSYTEFDNAADISGGHLTSQIGSWDTVKQEYKEWATRSDVSAVTADSEPISTGGNSTGKEQLLEEFHNVAKEIGYLPSYSEFSDIADLSGGHLTSQIGSWDEVEQEYKKWASAAGYDPITENSSDSDERTTGTDSSKGSPGSGSLLKEIEEEFEEF